MRKIKAGKKG